MNQFSLHPYVYSTAGLHGLRNILEQAWIKDVRPGEGTIHIVSGFGNYNGGVRFYKTFQDHISKGGKVQAFFGGSTSQRLTSRQVVEQLLDCGAEVNIVNRKRILHAKCYGLSTTKAQSLVLSSGNFTGPGMSQNIEASIFLDDQTTRAMGFTWGKLVRGMLAQNFEIYQPVLRKKSDPAWRLLYDEIREPVEGGEEGAKDVTLLLTLGHHDTARINARPGTKAGRGSQYFWLSKDCFDFFPPLTIRNERGHKATFSCVVSMVYVDLGVVDSECRVTFEAENNMDFRLGTGKLRYTGAVRDGDIAAISRTGESNYELRIFRKGSSVFNQLNRYAVNFIGHQGKKYGFISNAEFAQIAGQQLGVAAIRPS